MPLSPQQPHGPEGSADQRSAAIPPHPSGRPASPPRSTELLWGAEGGTNFGAEAAQTLGFRSRRAPRSPGTAAGRPCGRRGDPSALLRAPRSLPRPAGGRAAPAAPPLRPPPRGACPSPVIELILGARQRVHHEVDRGHGRRRRRRPPRRRETGRRAGGGRAHNGGGGEGGARPPALPRGCSRPPAERWARWETRRTRRRAG